MNEREKSIITPYFWPEQLDGLVPFTEVGNSERGPSLGIGESQEFGLGHIGCKIPIIELSRGAK